MLNRLFEISGIILGSLIVVPLLMATVRSMTESVVAEWNKAAVPIYEAKAAREGYPRRVLVSLDIFCNVVLWFGYQDETISSHSYRASLEGALWGRVMNGWLNWIKPNHGLHAASGDLERSRSEVARMRKLLGV